MNTYLDYVMRRLSNVLYNCSQRHTEENYNYALDSIKRMLEEYERAGADLSIIDFRERKS